jgi:hypothetical protein
MDQDWIFEGSDLDAVAEYERLLSEGLAQVENLKIDPRVYAMGRPLSSDNKVFLRMDAHSGPNWMGIQPQ